MHNRVDELHLHRLLAAELPLASQQRQREGPLQHPRLSEGGDQCVSRSDVVAGRIGSVGVANHAAGSAPRPWAAATKPRFSLVMWSSSPRRSHCAHGVGSASWSGVALRANRDSATRGTVAGAVHALRSSGLSSRRRDVGEAVKVEASAFAKVMDADRLTLPDSLSLNGPGLVVFSSSRPDHSSSARWTTPSTTRTA